MVLKKQGARRSGRKDKKVNKKDRYLSVIIPTQNDKHRLATVLIKIDSYLEKSGLTYEILIVDADSTDGTSETIKRLSELIKNARLVDSEKKSIKNIEEASCLATLRATGEWLLFLDIDRLPSLEDLLDRLRKDKNEKFAKNEVWVGMKPFLLIDKKRVFKKISTDWPSLILRFLFRSSMVTFLCLKRDSARNFWPLMEKEEKISMTRLFFWIKASGCQVGEIFSPIINQADYSSDKLYFWRFLGEWIKEKFSRR